MTTAGEGSCVRVTPSAVGPSVTVQVPNGAELYVHADGGGTLGVALSRSGAFPDVQARTIELPAGGVAAVAIPDLQDGAPWLARLTLPASGASLVCATTAA